MIYEVKTYKAECDSCGKNGLITDHFNRSRDLIIPRGWIRTSLEPNGPLEDFCSICKEMIQRKEMPEQV